MSTLQKIRRTAHAGVTWGATLPYLVSWARRNPAALREYMAAHSDHVTLEGASVERGGVYAVNSGWQGINWDAEPRGDNGAIYR